MGLWRDLNDPLVRDIVGSPVSEGAAANSTRSTLTRSFVAHTASTAEGRHEALLYGEPQDGGEAAAAARLDALPDGGTEDDLDREVVKLINDMVLAYGEAASAIVIDTSYGTWGDIERCSRCGAEGGAGLTHRGCGGIFDNDLDEPFA